MIFGTVTENVGQQMENTEDIQVILADRQEVLRILRKNGVHALWTDADAVFEDRTGSTVCFYICDRTLGRFIIRKCPEEPIL